ncbi:hypothetical protein EV699_10129 [Plasticicumulans lactativorans]|uniref:Uncharacterized protein n=1 Tax=Plasticicumulans lactativorans TaxID=1133106 RepID=A0A4V2SDI6_9GAMM|nr:hypothetical protein [Plasticicumulans lactativorans]TCO83645.1 hypothetical protein EV699_10129 [Plasticicumulans lactativorans]
MSGVHGIDLNGVLDCVVRLDRAPRPAPTPPVIVSGSPQGLLTGAAALQSPCGRPGMEAEEGIRLPVLALLHALSGEGRHDTHDTAVLLGRHLRSLLSDDTHAAVVAVPDTPGFDERARTRLLDGALRAGLDLHLLWRPVAALLGWGETLGNGELQALHGRTACVVQLLPDGISIGDFGLECVVQGGRPTLVPVRRRDGERQFYSWSGGGLVALLAREAGTDEASLWVGPWVWKVLLGQPAEREVLADPHAPGGWRLASGPSTLCGALAAELRTGLRIALGAARSALRNAAVILIEGPIADAPLSDAMQPTLALRQIVAAELTVVLGPTVSARLVAMPLADALIARGAAICAARQAARQITYYDFLPMLEINVLQAGEHAFVELIGREERIAGGMSYTNTLADRFTVAASTRSLEFYLLKEDEAGARHSETVLPVPPAADVEISLHVTQTPAQGYARVEILSAVRGALGEAPILLDWSAMTEIEGSREDILRELEFEGLGYPDIVPQRAHHLLWDYQRSDGMTIAAAMRAFNCKPILSSPRNQYNQLVKQTRALVGLRSNLFFLTKGTSSDRSAYTAVDSDGQLPPGIAPTIQQEFENFRVRLDTDFAAITSVRNRQDIATRRELARLGACLYAACPNAIVHYFQRIVARSADDLTLVLHAGKVLSTEPDLDSLFHYCASRYDEAIRAVKRLSVHVVRAAGDALAYHEKAGGILDNRSADKLAEAALLLLKEEIQAHNYKIRFRAAARLGLFLLRHRQRRRDFLHPSSADTANRRRAKEFDALLIQAIASKRLNQDLENALEEIRAQIRYRGTNAIVDIDPDEDGEINENEVE